MGSGLWDGNIKPTALSLLSQKIWGNPKVKIIKISLGQGDDATCKLYGTPEILWRDNDAWLSFFPSRVISEGGSQPTQLQTIQQLNWSAGTWNVLQLKGEEQQRSSLSGSGCLSQHRRPTKKVGCNAYFPFLILDMVIYIFYITLADISLLELWLYT